jgi:ABC-type amino acid transport substrate-binding protein
VALHLRALFAGLAVLLEQHPEAAAQTAHLRLCADPDNLPFSSKDEATPGIYIELGRQIAAKLGRSFEPVWTLTYFAKHELRKTLLADRCDGFIGLPADADFMPPLIVDSRPILTLGYALVTQRTGPATNLSDLAGRRVAVQFGSPPQNLLAEHGEIQAVTVLSPDEAMQDLALGAVDAAFIWGPSAGWINHTRLHDAYQVVPIAGPHMQWQVVVGFTRSNAALRDEVDRAISDLDADTADLEAKYGFPQDTPRSLEVPIPQAAAAAPTPSAPASDAQSVAAGHKLFNDNCAHCHGPDAVEGEPRRNLRMLHHRYSDEMNQVFLTTVTHGRLTKGMPNWSGILTDGQLHDILAFLNSLQEP